MRVILFLSPDEQSSVGEGIVRQKSDYSATPPITPTLHTGNSKRAFILAYNDLQLDATSSTPV